jgi:transposase InsO family protein
MGWFILKHIFSTLLAMVNIRRLSDQEKDLEILVLRQLFSAAHLRRVVIEFVDYYNTARPHQGIDQQTPISQARPSSGTIQCRNVLGGIIHDYYRAPTLLALPAT